jgi:hypothetical protein
MTTDPTNHDDLTRRLGATLHGHLDRVSATSDLTGPAVARARRIRRNRSLATGAAAAVAVLAVATPLAWSSLRGADEKPFVPASSSQTQLSTSSPTTSVPTQSAPAATTPQASTTTGSATTGTGSAGTGTAVPPASDAVPAGDNDAAPARVVTVTSSAPRGAAPDTAWTFDDTVTRGGRTTTLDVGTQWSYSALADGRGVVIDATWDQGGTVRIVDAAGRSVADVVAVPGKHATQIAVNAAGTRFTVLVNVPSTPGTGATITTFDADGAVVASKRNLLHAVDLAGIVGDRVFLGNKEVGRSYVWDLGTNVIDRYTDSGVVRAVNERTRQAVTFTANADSTSGCLAVLDVSGDARVVARSCGAFVPTGFSPDGRHLVGYPIETDGYAAAITDVLDVATGRIALRLKGAGFLDARFVDDATMALGLVHQYGRPGTVSDLQTCTLAGACSQFVDAAPMSDDTARYRLARQD